MKNELIFRKKSKFYWKWIIPLLLITILIISVCSSGFGGVVSDYSKAYTDPILYEIALKKVRQNARVKKVLGNIQPIKNTTILNGSVEYTDGNRSVQSTIKITGDYGKAMLDFKAERFENTWILKKMKLRIKDPIEKKETVYIISSTE